MERSRPGYSVRWRVMMGSGSASWLGDGRQPTHCDEATKDGPPTVAEPFMVLPERPEGWPEAEMPGCSSRRASARAMRSMVPHSMAWMGAS